MDNDTRIFPGPGAGVGAVATIIRTDDANGVIRLVTGSGTSPDSSILSLVYSSPFDQAPYGILISSANSTAALNLSNLFVPLSSVTEIGFQIHAGSFALPEGAEFDIYYSAGF